MPAADSQAPVVAIATPATGAAGLSGTVSFSVNASDNVDVTQVEFQADGVPIGTVGGPGPYNATLHTTAFASGQHVMRAHACDAAGNVSAWLSATVQFEGSRSQPAGVTRNEAWVTGLNSATASVPAPDGHLFVTQEGGALRVLKNGTPLTTPFLSVTVDPAGERGLLGTSLSPQLRQQRLRLRLRHHPGGRHAQPHQPLQPLQPLHRLGHKPRPRASRQ